MNPSLDSTQAVLQKAARAVGHPIVDVIMPFINANFANPDPLRRDAAVMSFGLILEGSDKPRLQKEIILPALPHFLAKLEGATRDPSPAVRSSTAYSLSVVFAEHLEVLAPYNDFLRMLAVEKKWKWKWKWKWKRNIWSNRNCNNSTIA